MKKSIFALAAITSLTACVVSDKADTTPADSTVVVAPAPAPAPSTSTLDTAAIPTTPPATPAPADPPLPTPAAWTIRSAGYGPLRVGMIPSEMKFIFGDSLVIPAKLAECDYIRPSKSPKGVLFMMVNGQLARVEVRNNTSIKTTAGAGIGDTEDRIKSLYPGQVTVQPHKYTDGHYLVVKPTGSAADERIIFETDGKKVTQYRAGRTPAVEYVESCS